MDDLSDLFLARPSTPAQPMMYRTGVVKSWNPVDATNVVTVDGADFINLPILNGVESLLLAPDAVVGIVDIGTTWAILGRMTVPGTTDAASALNALTIGDATIATSESTTSPFATDLATVGPIVNVIIGKSGRARVTMSCEMVWATTGGNGGAMMYDVDGPGTHIVATSTRQLAAGFASSTGGDVAASRTVIQTGLLNPGLYTFTAKYAAPFGPGNNCTFYNRVLTVEPL